MGYSTYFSGSIAIDRPLREEHKAYLTAFANTRRMQRDASLAADRPDPVREAAGLPVGAEGGYFVGSTDNWGQERSVDVLDYNQPPAGQPSLWCQWVPDDDGTAIVHDDGDKFHDYVEWMRYIIEHFLAPWDYTLNGEIEWYGDDRADIGRIVVSDNVVTVKLGRIVFDGV